MQASPGPLHKYTDPDLPYIRFKLHVAKLHGILAIDEVGVPHCLKYMYGMQSDTSV